MGRGAVLWGDGVKGGVMFLQCLLYGGAAVLVVIGLYFLAGLGNDEW